MAPIVPKDGNTLMSSVPLMVVQRYVAKPLLIDGFKFDLRIYVLINGISPLRVYVHKYGLARLCTVPYETPTYNNMGNLCMHLTNYAINKESDDFVQPEEEDDEGGGSKRSYQSVIDFITENFSKEQSDQVVQEINEIILKTLCIS
jgi:hypothetical protein